MANKHYVRSTFVYEEKPPSSKLNTWDDRISAGFSMTGGAISTLYGNDKVINDPNSSTELKVVATAVPDMNVTVSEGYALVADCLAQNASDTVKSIIAPTINPRYTIVQISNTGVVTTKNGAEAGSPAEPDADTDNIKLAAIYLPQNCAHINDTDAGQGYITDKRSLTSSPTDVKRQVSFYIPGTVFTTGGTNSDGYVSGTAAGAGWTPGDAITIEKGFISAQEIPTGADLVLTIHNKTQVTSDTITLSAGSATEEDTTIDLDFAITDVLAIQVTQVGSTVEGGYLNVVLQYVLS